MGKPSKRIEELKSLGAARRPRRASPRLKLAPADARAFDDEDVWNLFNSLSDDQRARFLMNLELEDCQDESAYEDASESLLYELGGMMYSAQEADREQNPPDGSKSCGQLALEAVCKHRAKKRSPRKGTSRDPRFGAYLREMFAAGCTWGDAAKKAYKKHPAWSKNGEPLSPDAARHEANKQK